MPEVATNPANTDDDSPTFVVGIGASAGGLEAIERLVETMPDTSGMAIVLVQHLSPDFRSLMDELLTRWTTMSIVRAENQMRVRRNTIHLMPAKTEMVIADGCLLLKEKDPHETLTLPIDHFFRSLAQDCGARAIGVVLSGTGSDGSRGIVDIKQAGGLVIVQREDTAKFDGMPRSARESGAADLFLPPEEIPEALMRFAEHPHVEQLATSYELAPFDETGIEKVFALIREHYGVDFANYKINTVVRRVERRLKLLSIPHVDEYVTRLHDEREELDLLYKDLLIGVTQFFRDEEAFEYLYTDAIEPIVRGAEDGSEIRVWVAACATGEEAYTVAMLLDEAITAHAKDVSVKIFATDLHRDSLDVASLGTYNEQSLSNLSPKRRQKYFIRNGQNFTVTHQLRQMIVFAPHNLVKDAPFTKIDLITCRNLLIYLQPPAQKKVLSLFHFGLKTGGYLLLGPSESTGDIEDEFDIVNSHWKLFKKRRDIRLPTDLRLQIAPMTRKIRASGLPALESAIANPDQSLMMSVYDALLSKVMPPSILISDKFEIVHTFGGAGEFIEAESGRHSNSLLDRVAADLRVPISTATRKALKTQLPVRYRGIQVSDNTANPRLTLEVIPIFDPRTETKFGLVQLQKEAASDADPEEPTERFDARALSAEQISSLETELQFTKENLQSTIEELETSNEELQATNEELVASNEELQSTNEELHSVNEELYTVNAEHQNKITQLSEVTRDMDSLLECTEVHTIFLDSQLRIRKFTPKVADSFNLLPQDIGRRIDSFTHSIECDSLAQKIERVISDCAQFEEEVRDSKGKWFLLRILPYIASPGTDRSKDISGAVLTLVDITKLKETSEALAASVDQRDKFLAMLSHELRNPLSTILNAIHIIDEKLEQEALEEPTRVIKRQSLHCAALLDDLLDVTRISRGKIRIQKKPLDVLRMVHLASESVGVRCKRFQQELELHLPETPVWVMGSEPRILQVLVNLLTNASKYSPDGSTIRVHVQGYGSGVEIVVDDDGVGLPADQLERVFDMFVQSDRTLDRSDGGLGVGLTLARAIVSMHGGTITASSPGEGMGSTFTIMLPTCDPVPTESESSHTLPMQPEPTRIVLVEDNVDAAKMLAYLLENTGCKVDVFHDGKAGMQAIINRCPDAALIDIGLPGMDGYEIAKSIRRVDQLNATFLIALTGYGQSTDRSKALSAGFNEHVVKPVDPNRLLSILKSAKVQEDRPE